MINYMENINTAIPTEFNEAKGYLVEKKDPLSPDDVLRKKAKQKSSFRNKHPICNWTMPAQPEGYIRSGTCDLL